MQPAAGRSMSTQRNLHAACFCGSRLAFDGCCGPIIDGAPAPTAEALMRSRYTAYVSGNFDHITNSLATEVRESFNLAAVQAMSSGLVWLGLDIRAVAGGGPDDDDGTVEFAARFTEDGKEKVHHERARFRREEGRWVYVDGEMRPKGTPRQVVKTGRNEPCPCGTGIKFKKCCGR